MQSNFQSHSRASFYPVLFEFSSVSRTTVERTSCFFFRQCRWTDQRNERELPFNWEVTFRDEVRSGRAIPVGFLRCERILTANCKTCNWITELRDTVIQEFPVALSYSFRAGSLGGAIYNGGKTIATRRETKIRHRGENAGGALSQ